MLFRGQGKGLAVIAVLLGLNASMSVQAKAGDALYASLGETARSPIGWVEFCAENPGDCRGKPTAAEIAGHAGQGAVPCGAKPR